MRGLRLAGPLLAALVVAGCAGKSAQPISASRPGDEQLTCVQIDGEANEILPKFRQLSNDSDKTGYNVAIGLVSAAFCIPCLFALDLSDAEKVEMQAYASRYQVLSNQRAKLNCPGTIPELRDSDGKIVAK